MQALKLKLQSLLPVNTYFDLDDSSQSFVVFPTNHIHLTNDFISIHIADRVYANVTCHSLVLSCISELYSLLTDYAYTVEDYCMINVVDADCIRLNWGGVYTEQDSKDFDSIDALIDFLKINK